VNYYSDFFDELIVFAANDSLKRMLQKMYSKKSNIKIEVPSFKFSNSTNETCLTCHMSGNNQSCPRENGKCKYIDYSNYESYKNIKIGAFNDYIEWDRYLKSGPESFAHAFYEFGGLNPNLRIEKFEISNVAQKEKPDGNYKVVHDDPERGINLGIHGKDVYHLNMKSDILIDQMSIIENSQEIHLIDSSYSVLIHLISFHSEKLANIPKFLYANSRPGRDLGIYKPTSKNWRTL
jgi:hypothetical protein